MKMFASVLFLSFFTLLAGDALATPACNGTLTYFKTTRIYAGCCTHSGSTYNCPVVDTYWYKCIEGNTTLFLTESGAGASHSTVLPPSAVICAH